MRFSSFAKVSGSALLLPIACGVWLLARPQSATATPSPKALQVEPATAPSIDAALDGGVPQSSTTATIVFITVPYVTSTVTWGRKLLGKIKPGKPLVVVRPRDSGPLDVIVRAPGYLSVQTRAHTFSDTRLIVKLTPIDKKSELLGYRLPIDAGVDGGEGGVLLEGGIMNGMPAPQVAPVPVPVQVPLGPPL